MHDDPTTPPAGASLGAVAVQLQIGSSPPRVAADGGRKADPTGLIVLRVVVPVIGDAAGARASARLTITGTAGALRRLLAAMAEEIAAADPGPRDAPLLTRPHDWPPGRQ